MEEINNFIIKDVYKALTEKTLPERSWILIANAKNRCEMLYASGIHNSTDLFRLVQNEEETKEIIKKTGLDKNYIFGLNKVLMFRRFKPTSLAKLEDVRAEYINSLKGTGIRNTGMLLNQCKTLEGRIDISQSTSIPEKELLNILSIADLMRLAGLKSTKSRLFMNAGIKSLKMLGGQKPEKFRKILEEIIKRTKIVKAVPTPKEMASDITWAKLHPVIIQGL